MVRIWIPPFALLIMSGALAVGQDQASNTGWEAKTSPTSAGAPPSESPPDPTKARVELDLAQPPDRAAAPAGTDWFWARADYLGWWLTGSRLPPFVTASPPGTPRSQAGVLGAPGAQVLFGGDRVNDDYRSGVRITVGGWLDECQSIGFEVRGLVLDRQADGFAAGSADGSLVVSRPFFDVVTGRQRAELVSFPGVLAGRAADVVESSNFWAFDALCRKSCCRDCSGCVDVLAGYRYLQFGDGVRLTEQLATLGATAGTRINLVDEFGASNRFNGGVVGLAAGYTAGTVSIELQAHVAVGETTRTVSIDGATQIANPFTGSATFPGGLLAQRTNIGGFRSSDWAVVPDLDLTVGCWLTSHCRFLVGYSLLYWPGVARTGDQIDFGINPSQLPPGTLAGPARPAFVLHRSDMWAQGLSVGVEYRY